MSEPGKPLAPSEQRAAPIEYTDSFPESCPPRSNFDAAICTLLGYRPRRGLNGLRDGRRASMLAALDHKATWAQIRAWRRGENAAPQWAVDLLRRKLRARIEHAKHVDSLLTGIAS